ncbi:MAG: adenylyltransferase/cytidyltransferase family protein [Acetatifactor sp.]|nr:adenylyltransferase/cytidyltransferase family protein [Acetatifactor sp.]
MKKYKIGYTTGVFDMFHIGHLNILKKAKEYCDYLIVGVTVDELVKEYKQKTPIVPYEERKAIVEAIKFVDEVVPQVSMDKLDAWERLHFDALFHGSDWKNSELYNKIIEQFKTLNVDVIFISHTPGISSTQLAEKILQQNNSMEPIRH